MAEIRVYAAQAKEMQEELIELVARYREAGKGDPEAKRVSVWHLMHPLEVVKP